MTSLRTSRALSFQAVFLAALVLTFAGFLMPLTTHALPPSGAEIDDGSGGDGGGGTEPGGGGGTAPTVSMVASPSSIESGRSSQLAFSSSGVTRCVIDNGIGEVTANRSDTRVVSPGQTTTYSISCYSSTQTLIESATVTVVPAPTPLTAYCEASPEAAQIDETVQWNATHSTGSSGNLAWKSGTPFTSKVCSGGQNYSELNNTCPDGTVDGNACSVEGQRCRVSAGCDGVTYTDPSGQPNASTQYGSVTPYTCVASSGGNAAYTYSWSGTDGLAGSTQTVSKAYATAGQKTGRATITRSTGGSASATCNAQISPKTPTATLTANPSSIQSGSPSILTWNSTNANSCTLNEGIGSVATSGTRSVSPNTTTTYTLMCTAPPTAVSGTWQYRESDISDFACPVTDINKAYSSVPNCPSNPQGKACNTSGACKVNRVDACNIRTDIYECSGSATSPAQSATASATVTVTATAPLPDLTAGSITPTSATAGTTQTFSASISNIGTSVASASATRFQRATSATGANATTISDDVTPAVQSGQGIQRSASHTFSSAGTYFVRACADTNAAVTESNEGNNCGEWTEIRVSPSTDPGESQSVSCQVSSRSVSVGGSVTYTASASGSAGAPYSWSSPQGGGPFGNSATVERTFTTANTYQMTVSARGGSNTATCPVVNVSLCPGTRTATLTATPNRVAQNGTTTLSWNATAINTSCTITGPGVNQRVNSSSCTVPDGSVVTPAITTQSTYTISCDNGAVTDTAIVNVIPQFEEF